MVDQIKERLDLDQLKKTAVSRVKQTCEQSGLFREMVCFEVGAISRQYSMVFPFFSRMTLSRLQLANNSIQLDKISCIYFNLVFCVGLSEWSQLILSQFHELGILRLAHFCLPIAVQCDGIAEIIWSTRLCGTHQFDRRLPRKHFSFVFLSHPVGLSVR